MTKLDPKKIKYIIREKRKQKSKDPKIQKQTNKDIARHLNITDRHVQRIYAKYRKAKVIPEPKHTGRPKKKITRKTRNVIISEHKKHDRGSTFLEPILRKKGIDISNVTIHKILKQEGLAASMPTMSKRKKWVEYEKPYLNIM